MREILFKDGRLIGQPLSVRQPDVRVVLHYHHIPLSGWRLAGTVLVSSPRLNGWGVKEIRFVETVK
ncbi:MAG: hypothetical protein ACI3YJ_11025 [Prevotella sp.]